jgi:hypothetical protein
LEKVRDKLPLLYERDHILLTMIQQRGDVERVSSRNVRLPLQIRPAVGIPANFTLEPGHATAAMFGLSGDSLMDWAAAKVPFLQKEIPIVGNGH